MDGATYLMDRSPGGWSDLVTNETLRLELRALTAEFRAEIGAVRHELGAEIAGVRSEMHQGFRDQTWRLMTALISVMAFFIAVIAALIKL